MLGETWEDQYKRMQRSYALLQRVADQYEYHEEIQQPDAARDILYHFCCDALHLRDWINKSSLPRRIRREAFKLFKVADCPDIASDALAACADIAIGSKHFEVREPYTPGKAATVTTQRLGATIPATVPFHISANHWTVDVGGVEHDALNLATRAVAAWDAWLTSHGLLPLPS